MIKKVHCKPNRLKKGTSRKMLYCKQGYPANVTATPVVLTQTFVKDYDNQLLILTLFNNIMCILYYAAHERICALFGQSKGTCQINKSIFIS